MTAVSARPHVNTDDVDVVLAARAIPAADVGWQFASMHQQNGAYQPSSMAAEGGDLANPGLARLTEAVLRRICTVLSADLAVVLQGLGGQRQMRVVCGSGPFAADLPTPVFTPVSSLLAKACRSGTWSRLPMLPLMGVPGSGRGRGLGPTLLTCQHHRDNSNTDVDLDDAGSGRAVETVTVLVVARLPHAPGFSAADLGALRRLLTAEHRSTCAAGPTLFPEGSSATNTAPDDPAGHQVGQRAQPGRTHVGLAAAAPSRTEPAPRSATVVDRPGDRGRTA